MNIDDALAAVRAAAHTTPPDTLLAAAIADRCTVQKIRFGPSVPIGDAFASGAALIAALDDGKLDAFGVVLRALAWLDGAAWTEAALALKDHSEGDIRRGATFALAHSTDDRALAYLLTALDGNKVPRPPLDRSVHPRATAAVRAIFDAAGIVTRGALREEDSSAVAAIGCLGARNDVTMFDDLVRMLDHADPHVRRETIWALAALRDPRAFAFVDERFDHEDAGTIFVRSSLQRDLSTAYDRLSTSDALATVLWAIHGGSTPRRIPAADDPLVVDPRWIDLAAQKRRDPQLGGSARMLLEIVPRDALLAALERNPIARTATAPAIVPAHRDWVARYTAGEHAVWTEIAKLPDAVAQHAELRAEAYATAVELMKRVRANRDVLRATLIASGAALVDEEAPTDDFTRVEQLFGPLPVAIEAFYRIVGSIRLVPHDYNYGSTTLEADGISLLALDPLEVWSIPTYALDEYVENVAESHPEVVGPLACDFAPDYLHKQNISGGPPYSFALPVEGSNVVDPFVDGLPFDTRFVPYLRLAFRWGGFPLLSVGSRPVDEISLNHRIAWKRAKGSWADASQRLLDKLRVGLVDF